MNTAQAVRPANNLPEYARDLNEAFDENPRLPEANEKYDRAGPWSSIRSS